jgi:hypothetical protein
MGRSDLRFSAAEGEPFYHYAFLVDPSEFDRAVNRLGRAARLLPDPDTNQLIFDFDFWDARACYALDPAGNIVELIAHRHLDLYLDPRASGLMVEISEIGLVCDDTAAVARALETLGIRLFDGSVTTPTSLAFAGTKGRALVLAPVGRGWLPTLRPSEVHPVDVTVVGAGHGSLAIPGLPYRVTAHNGTS